MNTPEAPDVEEDDVYDLDLQEYSFKLRDKDGKLKPYLMIEMDGTQRDDYMQSLLNRSRGGADGKTAMRDMKGLYASLLCRCVYDGTTRSPVSQKDIQAWPATTSKSLFERANKMNGMGKDAEKDAKND